VIFDATHSVHSRRQGTTSGGEREFVPVLALARSAVGVRGVFLGPTRQNGLLPLNASKNRFENKSANSKD